jgi:hypothetical protein
MHSSHSSKGRQAHCRPDDLRSEAAGGGSPMAIGTVAAESFRKAALAAYCAYSSGTFRSLDLPCWQITDGDSTIDVMELRRINVGEEQL